MIIRILILSFLSLWFTNAATAQVSPADQNYLYQGKDAAAAINKALVSAGAGENIKAHIQGLREDDLISSATQPISAEVDNLQLDKVHSHFDAMLFLKAGGKNIAPIRMVGQYDEMASVPVLKRRLQSPEVISENDIEYQDEPINHLRKTTVTDSKELIGKSPKRVISVGRPIRLDEIASPAILNKGSRITLMYKSPNIEIKTIGEAMDSGAKGDVVRVKNLASKSIIEGLLKALTACASILQKQTPRR